jgi:glycosyltransferase involved in cell wall biosynthesis
VNIQISCPVDRQFEWQVANSLVSTALFARSLPKEIEVDFAFISQCSIISKARNLQISEFLKDPKNDVLFFLDSDIVYNPRDLYRVVMLAGKHPIVGCPYPMKAYPISFSIQFKEKEDGVPPKPEEFDKDGLIDVYSMGLGFTAVRRNVLEKLAETADKVNYGAPFGVVPYICEEVRDEARDFHGEDWTFFKKARDLGFKAKAYALPTIGHIGSHIYYKPAEEESKIALR